MALHWLDLLIIGVIALSVITGLFRGFMKELIALGIWMLAIWLTINYAQTLDPFLSRYISDSRIRMALSSLIILLGTLLGGAIFNAILGLIMRRSGLSGVDRILGMAFGFIRGVLVVALVMTVIRVTGMPITAYTQQSQLYPKFDPLVTWMASFTPGLINKVKSFDTTYLIDMKPSMESATDGFIDITPDP